MADRSDAQIRTGAIPLLLVAALSALVVAAVYEVRAWLGKRAPEVRASATAEERSERAPGGRARPVPIQEECADLRQRYLARCPPDVDVSAPGAPAQQSSTAQAADRANAVQLDAWLNPSPRELEDMAGRCETRLDMPSITENLPPHVDDEAAAALALSSRERALLQRTLDDMHAELRGFAERALAEATGRSTTPLGLEEMLAELQTHPESGFEEARETLARERAGLIPPPASGAHPPPGERLLRLWAGAGEQFERRLLDELGRARAHQLRSSPDAAWMNRFSQSGCRRPL